ncbi:hypothetical protein JOM56_014013 [Amanita muscaria]
MYPFITFLSVLLSSVTFVLAQSACSSPEVTVNLRVEGYWDTFFEGPVTTCGHDVTTPSGGTHRCDGTNNGAQLSPSPTVTGVLDTAAALWNFTWDGTYDIKVDDFNVTAINGHQRVWSPFVNWGFVSINGCQVPLKTGDSVLWIQLRPDIKSVLKLDGPNTVVANEPFKLTVMDGFRHLPVEGATVRNHGTSDKHGHITLTLADQGIYKLKAEKEDAIRSNAVWIQVLPQEDKPKEE